MWKVLLVCAIVGLVTGKTYEGYKVFEIFESPYRMLDPMNLEKLMKEVTNNDTVKYWRDSNHNDGITLAQVIIAPGKVDDLKNRLNNNIKPIYYRELISNVQEMINKSKHLSNCSSFDFESYHTLDEIYKNLDDLAKQYPDKVQIIVGGKTYEERQIKGVKVSFKPNNTGVFIEGGINPREWVTPAVAMYLTHQLMTSDDVYVKNIAENYDWYIFPLFNPDGYVYTHTTDRMWKKTLKPSSNCECKGSDLTRNWDYNWETEDANSNPCSETYPGDMPFSEVETKSMSEYISSISDRFSIYLSLQTFSGSVIVSLPKNIRYMSCDNPVVEMLVKSGTYEMTKKTYDYIGRYSILDTSLSKLPGSSVDYVKNTYRKTLALLYELDDSYKYGFLHPSEEIIPLGKKIMKSLVTMLKGQNKIFNNYIWPEPHMLFGTRCQRAT